MTGKIALIVAADEPAIFYKDVPSAEADLEALDVRNGVYKAAYGPGGEPYDIAEDGEKVVIRPNTGGASRSQELKEVLKNFLRAMGISSSDNASIEELLEKCEPYVE